MNRRFHIWGAIKTFFHLINYINNSTVSRAREEFHTLAVRLWELPQDHTIFEETTFTVEAMDGLASLGSQKSQKMHGLYKETRNNSICL